MNRQINTLNWHAAISLHKCVKLLDLTYSYSQVDMIVNICNSVTTLLLC